ncbi:unnamed protein product [Ambrosiozyma monospora]|uniref:Unnamed protein product n=1 Tax=Ambrosiozyma monospora TaxID=43982 RepID=A0ACB5TSW1_AMBMO|nr:unnamed protein product [Ambrosiozyma monospora]
MTYPVSRTRKLVDLEFLFISQRIDLRLLFEKPDIQVLASSGRNTDGLERKLKGLYVVLNHCQKNVSVVIDEYARGVMCPVDETGDVNVVCSDADAGCVSVSVVDDGCGLGYAVQSVDTMGYLEERSDGDWSRYCKRFEVIDDPCFSVV